MLKVDSVLSGHMPDNIKSFAFLRDLADKIISFEV
jgi:hypothetical protein